MARVSECGIQSLQPELSGDGEQMRACSKKLQPWSALEILWLILSVY